MYKNRGLEGRNNIAGKKIEELRKAMPKRTSQRVLSVMLQDYGIDLDKNAIQRIECGKRFITDIELVAFAKCLNVSLEELLSEK